MSALVDVSGRLRKMPVEAGQPVDYVIQVGDTRIPLNEMIGYPVQIDYDGVIRCIHCNLTTKVQPGVLLPVFPQTGCL